MGKFVDKITGADKAEKLIDAAYLAAQKHFDGAQGQGGSTTGSNTNTASSATSNSQATPAPGSSASAS